MSAPPSHPIYLDHAATSWPKPIEVQQEMVRALTDLMANAGRSGHAASLHSARVVFQTRQRWAEVLGVRDSENLVIVRGCTEGLNLVLNGWLKRGDVVAVSPMEHNSVMRPLSHLEQDRGISIVTLPADSWGRVDPADAQRTVREKSVRLVAISHASNVNGVIQDLGGLREALPDTPFLVDAAQTAGVLPISVEQQQIDFLACSAHKGILGPTGVGACYLDPRHEVAPLMEGGTGSRSESLAHPHFTPDRYEAGTMNLHGIAGTWGALQGLTERGLLGESKRQLCGELLEGLQAIPGVRLHSPPGVLCVSFTIDGLSPDEVAVRLENEFGVLCRPGLQCSPVAHHHLGTFPAGTVRLSPGWQNTSQQIDAAIRGVHRIASGH
jgi:cysteine desulfurase family protein